MKARPPFSSTALREELLGKLNAIEGVSIPADGLTRRPSIPLGILSKGDALERFLEVIDWYLDRLVLPS